MDFIRNFNNLFLNNMKMFFERIPDFCSLFAHFVGIGGNLYDEK